MGHVRTGECDLYCEAHGDRMSHACCWCENQAVPENDDVDLMPAIMSALRGRPRLLAAMDRLMDEHDRLSRTAGPVDPLSPPDPIASRRW